MSTRKQIAVCIALIVIIIGLFIRLMMIDGRMDLHELRFEEQKKLLEVQKAQCKKQGDLLKIQSQIISDTYIVRRKLIEKLVNK